MQNIAPDTLLDGRYRVQERLGSGGMADVYRATDQQLGRTVALKLLYRRFAEDADFVERFRREASSAAGLQHPNVVSVFDRGEWDGTYYIAMEYLEGASLKDLVREQGPLDPARAVELIVQVLKAARFAHRRGIIHRDFKPHNVIVDAEGRAKVTDFGIAKAGASDMTETGAIMGTAQYLSPEQAQGHVVTAQSDLYSIGILLYELLTGQPPFAGDSPVTIALKQVSEAPVLPSASNPAVTSALESVVLHALEKDPARRFADADEFIVALAAAMDGGTAASVLEGSTGVYPALAVEEELERSDRRVLRTLGLALLAVLVVAGLAAGAYLLLRADRIVVPDVVRNRSATAQTRLANAGFVVNTQQNRSETVPEDRVFRQDPQPGEELEKGATVTIVVSAGPGDATVPSLERLTLRSAQGRLERAGFNDRVRRETSATVPGGRVIESSPPEGSRLQKGRAVVLVVSSGPESVEVPDVVGRTQAEAEAGLRAAGLEATVTEQEDEEEAPGTVMSQAPGAGRSVEQGSSVRLTVASRPALVDVPDVVGQSRAAATATLREAGFVPRVRRERVESLDEDGDVVEQNPGSGERRERGATVFVTVGVLATPKEEARPTATPSPTPTPTSTPTPTPTP